MFLAITLRCWSDGSYVAMDLPTTMELAVFNQKRSEKLERPVRHHENYELYTEH